MERVYPQAIPLDEEQQSQLDKVETELEEVADRLEHEHTTDEDNETYERLRREAQALRDQGEAYDQSDIERSGCYVHLDYRGMLAIERGLVQPAENTQGTPSQQTPQSVDGADKSAFKMPAAFEQELSAQKTAAIRAELACNPTVALAAVVHALASVSVFLCRARKDCA